MQYNRFNKYFEIITFILFTIFITLFFGSLEIMALENISLEIPDFIPVGTIILDEPSSQEIIYISSDQSVLLFRNSTPQLEQLQSGDVLLLNVTQFNASYLLFRIKHMIKERPNNKGIMIEVVPWENHPPFISALIAQPSTLEAGQRSYLTCHAADQDGDMLHYTWISSEGTILGNDPGIIWIAPEQTGSYSISCEVMDKSGDKDVKLVQLFVVEKLPLLSNEEKELIRRFGWGWGGNKTIRWPDGYVEVYDATNFSKMQEVLNQWNEVLDGKVIFYLSNNPQSPVKVTYNSALRKENLCGHIDTHWESNRLYAAEITINPDGSFCDYPENSYALYLHFFSGVAGFDAWKGEVVEKRDWQNFNLISEIMQMMIKALYKVPPGYDLNKDQ